MSARATILDGNRLDSVSYQWSAGGVGTVTGLIRQVPDSDLPIDVYLTFDDSPITHVLRQVQGGFIVVEQLRSGPAPNSGHVAVYSSGRLLTLFSEDIGQDRLLAIGEKFAANR